MDFCVFNLLPLRHLTNLLKHVAKSVTIFRPAFFVRTGEYLTCLPRYLEGTEPMFRREPMVRQMSHHIVSRMLSCHRPFFAVHAAQDTTAFHRTVPPFFWQSALLECDSGSFFHSADGSFCHSVRVRAMMGACVMIPW